MSDEETKVEDQEKDLIDGHDATYWKQQAEQNDGNFHRVQTDLETVNVEKEAVVKQLAENQVLIDKTKAETETHTEFKTLDPDLVDPNVSANLETLQKQQAEDRKQFEELKGKVVAYEKDLEDRAIKAREDGARTEVLDYLDDQAGTKKYRSKAMELADEAVKVNPSLRPKSMLEATKFVGKYYKQLKDEAEKKPEPSPEDKGDGSLTLQEDSKKKKGTFKEVFADMKKNWKMGD